MKEEKLELIIKADENRDVFVKDVKDLIGDFLYCKVRNLLYNNSGLNIKTTYGEQKYKISIDVEEEKQT